MIGTATSAFVAWIYAMAAGGLFGKIFTSYSKINEFFKSSLSVALIGNGSRAAKEIRKLRFSVAELFEESAMLYLWRRIALFLVGCRVRFYGSFTFIFGIYTGLVYLLKRYAFPLNYADDNYILIAAILILLSLPMLLSKKTVAATLTESRAGNFIVSEFLGIPKKKLDIAPAKHGDSYNIAIVFGLVFGSLTYFVSPIVVIMVLFAFVAVALVLSYPEIGVLMTSLLLPFFSFSSDREGFLLGLVSLYSFGYFIKLLRGKRIIKINAYDFLMLAFGAVILFGGPFGIAGDAGMASARMMATLLVGAFVALNLIRTADWLRRCGFAVLASSFAVSLLIIFSYVIDKASAIRFIAELSGSLPSELVFFGGIDDAASYLVMAFGVALAILNLTSNGKVRFLVWIGAISMPAAVLALGSKVGFFGMAVTFVSYCVITRRKTTGVMLAGSAGLAYAAFMIPSDMLRGVYDLLDSFVISLWRTVSVWQGAIGAALTALFVGAGVDSFNVVYPRLAFAGSETVAEASSLVINILCELGVVGVILFSLVIFLFVQNCFEYIKRPVDRASSLMTSGGLCAVIGVLASGMFYDVFSDNGIFFMFWILCSFTVACIRIGRAEAQRTADIMSANENAATLDI